MLTHRCFIGRSSAIITPVLEYGVKRLSYTISALAHDANVTIETIRFYQRKGLLLTPPKPLGGIRRYDHGALARLRFIRAAQRLGFTLDEVAQLLKLEDGMHCDEARQIAEQRLSDISQRIADLQCMASTLAEVIVCCESPAKDIRCPLINSLQLSANRAADERGG